MAHSLATRIAALSSALALSIGALAGCSETSDTSGASSQSAQTGNGAISPSDVKDMVDAGEKFAFLDVRTPEEYNEAHIEGAENLPVDTIDADTAALFIDSTDTPVVLYCRSGHRAGIALETLQSLGYTNVKNMGGISGWTWGYVSK